MPMAMRQPPRDAPTRASVGRVKAAAYTEVDRGVWVARQQATSDLADRSSRAPVWQTVLGIVAIAITAVAGWVLGFISVFMGAAHVENCRFTEDTSWACSSQGRTILEISLQGLPVVTVIALIVAIVAVIKGRPLHAWWSPVILVALYLALGMIIG
ncbi:hypothetical protein BH24ACT15_BH24ACT15_16290 [soil metagenome]